MYIELVAYRYLILSKELDMASTCCSDSDDNNGNDTEELWIWTRRRQKKWALNDIDVEDQGYK